jgi:hypothetical protein
MTKGSAGRGLSRRDFLKATGASLAGATLFGTGIARGGATAFAQEAGGAVARRADDLVGSIGVNTHFSYLGDRQYEPSFGTVKQKLAELGIRHIRDGVDDRSAAYDKVNELYRDLGVTALLGFNTRAVDPDKEGDVPWDGSGRPDFDAIDDKLAVIKTYYPESCDGIEGINEYDITNEGDPDYGQTMLAYQQELWRQVQADDLLKTKPVLGLGLAYYYNAPNVPELGGYLTFGNMHPYPGPYPPTRELDVNISATASISGGKALWATETGYQNNPDQYLYIPAEVSARYGPRLAAEYFRAGVARTYYYELIDEPGGGIKFGFLDENLNEKPIFGPMKNMIALLEDGGEPFTPGSLGYSWEGDTTNVHDLLLQKRDGRFYLLVWQEVPGYDPDNDAILNPPGRNLRLNLAKAASSIKIYRPATDGTEPVREASGSSVDYLGVSDRLKIVEITPGS